MKLGVNNVRFIFQKKLWNKISFQSFYSMGYNSNKHNEVKQEQQEREHIDIIIAGGGMVGFAAACSLGSSSRLENKKILLIEKQPKRAWELPEEYSNRVCALNPQTVKLLSKVGAWDLIETMRCQPVKKMQVWEDKSEALITFDHHDTEGQSIAHIVENDVVLESLKRVLKPNVEVLYGSQVERLELPLTVDPKVNVDLDDGRTVSCDLLIGADGAHSGVRKAMGTKYMGWQYDHSAIVATLELSEEQENFVAWQKFLSTGPIAILPLSSSRSSLVWSASGQKCAELLSLSEQEFGDALNNALWQDEAKISPSVQSVHSRWQDLLTTLTPGGSKAAFGSRQLPPSISRVLPNTRASFPLGLGHSANYVAPRTALVGDAAHKVHPLAGQGVNLGFGDVASLTRAVEEAVLMGEDLGDIGLLKRYETSRQRHNVPVMASIDALYRLYSSSFAPVVLLRSLGLSAVHSCAPLKKRIMSLAEG